MGEKELNLQEQLESLQGYLEHLDNKYSSFGKVQKTAEKEMKRVSKRINELSRCERHTGKHGLDCFMCKMERMF